MVNDYIISDSYSVICNLIVFASNDKESFPLSYLSRLFDL